MKTIDDFDCWAVKNGLSLEARKVIEHIRNSEPARKVRSGGKNNVYGFYPSLKMGVTIQFESHKLELAGIYEKEMSKNVIEYYDQPPTFTISYLGNNGKKIGHRYTADYFVIEDNWIGWEEWKPEEQLIKLSEKYPTRYVLGKDGEWRCPPAEEYANELGLSFRVVSSRDINWVFQRNIQFLEDYLLFQDLDVPALVKEEIINLIGQTGFISLGELLDKDVAFTSDDVYTMIGLGLIYADLYKYPITDSYKFPLFINKESADAYQNLEVSQSTQNIPQTIDVFVNQTIIWNLEKYRIINSASDSVSLLSEKHGLIELPKDTFEQLISKGSINSLLENSLAESKNDHMIEAINSASPKELQEANRKFNVLQRVLSGLDIEDEDVPSRTIRHWKSKYLYAEKVYGNGYIGLLPNRHLQGNRNRKIPSEVITLMTTLIEQDYENKRQKNKSRVYEILVDECMKKGYSPPSFKTFCNEIDKRSKHEIVSKRQGPKAAYDTEKMYFELDQSTPRHGDMPFQTCHIDHTQLDIELICSQTKRNLGRPWVTLLMDAYSRRILAFYLTFDSPSYRSCMMVLRECVIRHSRLPKKIVVDGGKEFHSVYFDTLLASYNCAKHVRPGGKPKFGSVCERLFGVVNKDFIHNLLGNTQITKEVRKITKPFNPKNNSVWTLENLYLFLKEWSYEIYDKRIHGALDQSPRSMFITGITKYGERKQTYIVYDELFKMLTLPTTSKGTAKVIPGKGVKINTFFYWSDVFNHPFIEGEQVPIKYDPFNYGIAYAYANNQWVELVSQHYNLLINRTEKEMKIITEEVRRRKRINQSSRAINNSDVVDLLRNAETFEELQIQNLKDQALRNIQDDNFVVTENKEDSAKNDKVQVVNQRKERSEKLTIEAMITANKFETYEEF